MHPDLGNLACAEDGVFVNHQSPNGIGTRDVFHARTPDMFGWSLTLFENISCCLSRPKGVYYIPSYYTHIIILFNVFIIEHYILHEIQR